MSKNPQPSAGKGLRWGLSAALTLGLLVAVMAFPSAERPSREPHAERSISLVRISRPDRLADIGSQRPADKQSGTPSHPKSRKLAGPADPAPADEAPPFDAAAPDAAVADAVSAHGVASDDAATGEAVTEVARQRAPRANGPLPARNGSGQVVAMRASRAAETFPTATRAAPPPAALSGRSRPSSEPPMRAAERPPPAATANPAFEAQTTTETAALRSPAAGSSWPEKAEGHPLVSEGGLDPGFRLVEPVRPGYPALARRLGKSGEVRLELEIDPAGRVTRVSILAETEAWGFGATVRDAYRAARFTAPTRGGKPVRVVWRKTLRFRP